MTYKVKLIWRRETTSFSSHLPGRKQHQQQEEAKAAVTMLKEGSLSCSGGSTSAFRVVTPKDRDKVDGKCSGPAGHRLLLAKCYESIKVEF